MIRTVLKSEQANLLNKEHKSEDNLLDGHWSNNHLKHERMNIMNSFPSDLCYCASAVQWRSVPRREAYSTTGTVRTVRYCIWI